MTQYTWIENGLLIDPANNREGISDVFIKDGLIVDKLSDSEKKKAVHFDAKGFSSGTGQSRYSRAFPWARTDPQEDIASGSRAAAAGGYTSVVCVPNTSLSVTMRNADGLTIASKSPWSYLRRAVWRAWK